MKLSGRMGMFHCKTTVRAGLDTVTLGISKFLKAEFSFQLSQLIFSSMQVFSAACQICERGT
jgi:hypothetical protein